MRRVRFLPLISTLLAISVSAPTAASTATDPARIQPPAASASAVSACSLGGFANSRHLAADADLPEDWSKIRDRKRCAALARLLVAAETFASAVALHETDHSFAAVGSDISAAQAAERHVFRRTLKTLVADADPRAPLMTAREADGALNAAYNEVMAVANPQNLAWGSVEKSGIRKAERAWLAYRDAFVAFAAALDQPGKAERVKIELTARRAASLEAFLAD